MKPEVINVIRYCLYLIIMTHAPEGTPSPPTAPLSNQTLGLTLFRLLNHPKNMERLEFLQMRAPPPQRKRDSTLVQGIKHLPTFQELKSLGTG